MGDMAIKAAEIKGEGTIRRSWCSLPFHTWSGKWAPDPSSQPGTILLCHPFYPISKPPTPLRWSCLGALSEYPVPQSTLEDRFPLAGLLFRPPAATCVETTSQRKTDPSSASDHGHQRYQYPFGLRLNSSFPSPPGQSLARFQCNLCLSY